MADPSLSQVGAVIDDGAWSPAVSPSADTFVGKLNRMAGKVGDAIDNAYHGAAVWTAQTAETIKPKLETFATETAELGTTVGDVGNIVGIFRPDIGARLQVLDGAMEKVDDRFEEGSAKVENDLLRYETDPNIIRHGDESAGVLDARETASDYRGSRKKKKPKERRRYDGIVGKPDNTGPKFGGRN